MCPSSPSHCGDFNEHTQSIILIEIRVEGQFILADTADIYCQNRTEQNITLLKTMHLRPLTGGVRDKHKHVMQ